MSIKTRWVMAAGLIAAAGPACAGPAGEAAFFAATAAPGIRFPAPRDASARPQPGEPFAVEPGSYGALAAAIPLARILDGIRSTRSSFRSGDAVVHVFGGKSQNKKNWFIGFAVEGSDAQFRNGRKMLHWVFVNRTVHVAIGSRNYAVYIEGKAKDKLHSRVVVEPEDKSEPRSSWTIAELSAAAYDAAVPVVIGGKEYRLFYTRDFEEDERGEFGGYTSDRSLTLMERRGEKLIGYHWFEREIPADRILVAAPKAVGAEDSAPGALTVGLRLKDGVLEIYAPRSAAVAKN